MPAALPVFAVLVLIGVVSLLRSRRRCGLYLALLYAVPVGVMWLVAPYDLYPRFFLFLLPWNVLLVALGARQLWDGAARLGNAPRRVLQSLMLLALAVWIPLWTITARSTVVSEGYRPAAESLAAESGDDVLLVAVGGGAELVSYYLDEPVFLPETLAEFRARAATVGEIRVVHRYTPWQSSEHARIVEFLRRKVPGRSYAVRPPMRVYVWRP